VLSDDGYGYRLVLWRQMSPLLAFERQLRVTPPLVRR